MLDTTLFNVNISPPAPMNNNKALILSGCQVSVQDDIVYSELDEHNFYYLNSNDYGHGKTDIKICFENSFDNPYFKFYIQCVSIRTDNEVLSKINRNQNTNRLINQNYSKVTKDGKVSLGIGYYFKTAEEQYKLMGCKSFCIEGFVALGKKNNVYGFMCRIDNLDNKWKLSEGNTYRIYKHIRISSLYH